MITITLNNEPKEVANGSTVLALIQTLPLDSKKIAVEKNGEIVRKSMWEKEILGDGDSLEIIEFVGGG
jgi:thiamine biosynthesis protein ThiS